MINLLSKLNWKLKSVLSFGSIIVVFLLYCFLIHSNLSIMEKLTEKINKNSELTVKLGLPISTLENKIQYLELYNVLFVLLSIIITAILLIVFIKSSKELNNKNKSETKQKNKNQENIIKGVLKPQNTSIETNTIKSLKSQIGKLNDNSEVIIKEITRINSPSIHRNNNSNNKTKNLNDHKNNISKIIDSFVKLKQTNQSNNGDFAPILMEFDKIKDSLSKLQNLAKDNQQYNSDKNKDLINYCAKGITSIKDISGELKSLDQSTKSILSIIQSIQGVVDKTKHLTTSAAIEATYAGEYGKGFAIVADEMKKSLTDFSDNNNLVSKNITSLLDRIKNSVELSNSVENDFNQVINFIQHQINSNFNQKQNNKELFDLIFDLNLRINQCISQFNQQSNILKNNNEIQTELISSMELIKKLKQDLFLIQEETNPVDITSKNIESILLKLNDNKSILQEISKSIEQFLQFDENTSNPISQKNEMNINKKSLTVVN